MYIKGLLVIILVQGLLVSAEVEEPSVSVYQKIDSFKSAREFVQYFTTNVTLTESERTELEEGLAAFEEEHRNQVASFSFNLEENCTPEMTSVHLGTRRYPSANALTYPLCSKVRRCLGCCGHDNIKCLPKAAGIKKKTINYFEVIYDAKTRKDTIKVQMKEIEEHTACECACKQKAEDCEESVQTYKATSCSCVCKRKQHCFYPKIWNAKLCRCEDALALFNIPGIARVSETPVPTQAPTTTTTERSGPCVCRCPRHFQPVSSTGTDCRCKHTRRDYYRNGKCI